MRSQSVNNDLEVEVYSNNARVTDIDKDLTRFEALEFGTMFPGGIFADASLFIKRDPLRPWLFKGGQQMRIRHKSSHQVVFEGTIGVGYHTNGRSIQSGGPWGQLLGVRGINKPWADNRMDEATWPIQPGTTLEEAFTLRRLAGILQFVPKAELFANGDYAAVRRTVPTGQTIKRVKLSYNLQEGAQAWAISLYDVTGAANIFQITASATNVRDDTLGTPRQVVELRFTAQAAQTPTSDGTYFGQFDNAVSGANAFMVYTETGNINPTEIAKDIRAAVSGLNSDESKIGSNTLTLEPFITNGYEMFASILARVAAYGDSSFNQWGFYVVESELASTPDGKPVLAYAQWPSLTDYDLVIRADDKRVTLPGLYPDYENIWNYVIVKYQDELSNRDVFITPDDDANLKDATSISNWNQREYVLDVGAANSTTATNMGRRFLAEHKDLRITVNGTISVTGSLEDKNGQTYPVSRIRSRQRVKITNFLTDEIGVSGAGLTFVLTGTRYTHDSKTVQLTCGRPDPWSVLLAQRADFGVVI